jgi:hypothetical protein
VSLALGNMTFRRFGRTYHLRIRSAADLRQALDLGEAHWVAVSAPIDTIHCDSVFLELLDSDRDGRVRPFELKQAIRWTLGVLRDTDDLSRAGTDLRIAAINADAEDGGRILAAIEKIHSRFRAERPDCITLAQVREIKRLEEEQAISGVGVVLSDAARDEDVASFMEDIIATVGGVSHPGGGTGIAQQNLDRFLSEARAFLSWRERERVEGDRTSNVMPFAGKTPAMFIVLRSVREKVDQYFAQCEAVTLDPALAQRFGSSPERLNQMDLNDPAIIRDVLERAPLAPPDPRHELDLDATTNPAYSESLARLREAVLKPILGTVASPLTKDAWQRVKEAFAAHEDWVGSKTGTVVEPLGEAKLRDYVDGQHAEKVGALIEKVREAAIVLEDIRLVEKLILFQANLITFANNYVSFPDLYEQGRRALFDYGDLVMDGRRFNLAVRLTDRTEHARIAKTSNIHVLYVEITGPEVEPYEVAIAVTSGGQGNLCVGKRGVLRDVNGLELDARIVQVIENPISLSEAIVAPFRRLGAAAAGKIESIATAAEKKLDQAGSDTVVRIPGVGDRPPPSQAAQQSKDGGMGPMLAGGGIAVAALGSSFAFITKTLAGLSVFTILVGLGGALLAVIVPMLIIAFGKLRRRDLSAILEGSGWAINARMRLTRAQAKYFTERPPFPARARGIRRTRAVVWVIGVALVAGAAVSLWMTMRDGADPRGAETPSAQRSPDSTSSGGL